MKKHFLLLVCALLSAAGFSQEMGDNSPEPEWEFALAPYMLFGSVSGDATLGAQGPLEVDANFGDIMENLQFAFMLHGEVYKGKWGLMADYFHLKLGSDISTPEGGIVDAEFRQTIVEVFGAYRIKKSWGQYDLFAGIRTWGLGVDLELQGEQVMEASADRNWVDPVVGGKVLYKSPKNIILGMRADIGGFGLGSDFSFNLQPSIGYQFSDLFTLMLQYKYLYSDYKDGTRGTSDYFALDAATHGPLLGFVFRF
jgi:hypothetical protein